MRRFCAPARSSFRHPRGQWADACAAEHARPGAGASPADRRQHHARARSRRVRRPSNLRWSVDSERLYFAWRKPGEKEDVALRGRARGRARRNGCRTRTRRPRRRPTDAGTRPAGGCSATQGGDIFIHDPAAPAGRVAVTRTSAPESNPRWARNDTHVTYVRDGNLFIVPVQAGSGRARHAAHRRRPEKGRAAPHRQPEVPARRGREADRLHPRAAAGQAEGRGESQGRQAARRSSCRIGRRPPT